MIFVLSTCAAFYWIFLYKNDRHKLHQLEIKQSFQINASIDQALEGVPKDHPVWGGINRARITQEDNPLPEVDTSNWKLYRNEEFGFELKLPLGWIEKISDNHEDGVSFTHPDETYNNTVATKLYGDIYIEPIKNFSLNISPGPVHIIRNGNTIGLLSYSLEDDIDGIGCIDEIVCREDSTIPGIYVAQIASLDKKVMFMVSGSVVGVIRPYYLNIRDDKMARRDIYRQEFIDTQKAFAGILQTIKPINDENAGM